MHGLLNGLLENSSLPFITALILGLMTAISPCPMATNITAIGFLGKDIENRNRVFYNGIVYTLGRAITYTLLAVIIFLGADQFTVIRCFSEIRRKNYWSFTANNWANYARYIKNQISWVEYSFTAI